MDTSWLVWIALALIFLFLLGEWLTYWLGGNHESD
jgi:hypothetical protein